MMSRSTDTIPRRAGVGLKPQHYHEVLAGTPPIGFFEVHAENYMGAGGPPHRYLTQIRSHYPLSLHGVGLSIGADRPLAPDHLQRLASLIARYEPGLFSEHLAWSTHGRVFYDDLLPVPYTKETLHCVVSHINQVQETLGQQMLLENPSSYLIFERSSYSEMQFIAEVARRTGCALLFDVNNLYVSCTNHGWDPQDYIKEFPLAQVRQIHLAGHGEDRDERGAPLLIDSHDRPVAECVWSLYAAVIERLGPTPTIIEWDTQLPTWSRLQAQAEHAETIMADATRQADATRHADARRQAGERNAAAC